MNQEGISLGWNCSSAVYGVSTGIRRKKEDGYKTCPFDEMITNYKGLIECIKDDFKYLCDIEYLELIKIPNTSKYFNTNGDGDVVIYNNKYKFIFNHESPGHANLYITQNWKNGINHYIINNYEEFINRYKRRIENFKNYLLNTSNIIFILTRPNTTQLLDINELNDVIKNKYPLLNFNFILLDQDKYSYYDHLILMNIDKNDEEIKRLCI